jgi:predicted DNA-binding transcriptional regulator YafY
MDIKSVVSFRKNHEEIANNGKATILYSNYKGETKIREILPEKIWYGSTKWHPEMQWLLDAYDIEKREKRSFALSGIRAWF